MRGVAYALTASVALVCGALTSASAGCYGECNGYQDNRYGPPAYERPYREPVYQGSYDSGPRYHTTYYERGEEYPVSYREYPAYRSSYDDGYDGGYSGGYSGGGYYERPYRHYHGGYSYDRPRYGGYGYGYGGYGYRGYGGYGGRLRLWLSDGPYRRRLVANCIGLGLRRLWLRRLRLRLDLRRLGRRLQHDLHSVRLELGPRAELLIQKEARREIAARFSSDRLTTRGPPLRAARSLFTRRRWRPARCPG